MQLSEGGEPVIVFDHHCCLADVLVRRLQQDATGQRLASALVPPTPLLGVHAQFGPDLNPIVPAQCSGDRLTQSCRPAFSHILGEHGLDASLPEGV